MIVYHFVPWNTTKKWYFAPYAALTVSLWYNQICTSQ